LLPSFALGQKYSNSILDGNTRFSDISNFLILEKIFKMYQEITLVEIQRFKKLYTI